MDPTGVSGKRHRAPSDRESPSLVPFMPARSQWAGPLPLAERLSSQTEPCPAALVELERSSDLLVASLSTRYNEVLVPVQEYRSESALQYAVAVGNYVRHREISKPVVSAIATPVFVALEDPFPLFATDVPDRHAPSLKRSQLVWLQKLARFRWCSSGVRSSFCQERRNKKGRL